MEKGQGSTEYLLILVIALIVAAIAIIFIHRAGLKKPMSILAAYDTNDNSIDINVQSGSIPSNDWKWRILNPDGSENEGWTDATVDLDPMHSPIELKKLGTNPIEGPYRVQVYHKPTKSIYVDMEVTVSSK
jgi:hypothetical protein